MTSRGFGLTVHHDVEKRQQETPQKRKTWVGHIGILKWDMTLFIRMSANRRYTVVRRFASGKDAADKMGIIRTVTTTAFVYSVAFIVAFLAFSWLCTSILLHPTRIFWRVKRRKAAPECLTDPAYGIHGYLPIEVRSGSFCLVADH